MKKPAKIYNLQRHEAPDVINAPAHYVEGRTIEPIEVIEDWNLSYHLGSALKYIARAGRKDNEIWDLQKAIWFLERRKMLLESKKT